MLKKILTLALVGVAPVSAHEFWIEPLDYTLDSGQVLEAEVRSGEFFEGDVFPFMPQRIVAAEVVNDTSRVSLQGRAGDFPALTHRVNDGLSIVSYQSTPSTHTHSNFAEFQHFLQEDGLQWVEQVHRERKLPVENFSENFTRYAKALVTAGKVSGQDQAVGLPYELIVMSPMGDNQAVTVELQLLARGEPAQNTQVTVFRKKSGSLASDEPLKLRTNRYGQVSIPVTGGHEYLASAVIMTAGKEVPWHSHWTSVTFEVSK